jgi:hypothetical protein
MSDLLEFAVFGRNLSVSGCKPRLCYLSDRSSLILSGDPIPTPTSGGERGSQSAQPGIIRVTSTARWYRLARRGRDGRFAARLYAIANALDGISRAEAARLAGMERQALRDATLQCGGFVRSARPPQRTPATPADRGRGGRPGGGDLAWSRARAGWRRLGFSRQKARPAHSQHDAKAQQRFQKRGSARRRSRRPQRIPWAAYLSLRVAEGWPAG